MREKIRAALLFTSALVLGSCQREIINTKKSQDKLLAGQFTSADLTGTSYTFVKVFNVTDSQKLQGLAFGAKSHFLTFAMDSEKASIVQYNSSGTELKRGNNLSLGHGAEVSYRQANGNLYVANGGLLNEPTYVYEVDMSKSTPIIRNTINFSSLGANGMVAVDNSNGRLLVFTGPNGGPYTISTADFNGKVLNQFSISEHLGTPQGIEVIGNEILYYTSQTSNNLITVYSTAGTKLYSINVPITAEGEGLSIDEATRTVYVGARKQGVYRMSPAFVSDALLNMNLLINQNAEGGAAASDASVSVPIPFWTANGITVIRYGTGSFPDTNSPGSPNRRVKFFAGNPVSNGTLKQQVNVSNLSADIDLSSISYSLQGWLGGYSSQDDNAKVTATFFNSSNTILETITIGPVMAADRNNVTGMVKRSKTGIVPPGTRSILIVITMTRVAGTDCDAYADDLSLILTKF